MKKTVITFVAGVSVGIVTGLLIAPQSGKRTREDFDYAARRTKRGFEQASWQLSNKKNQMKRGFRKQVERFDLS